MAKMPNPIVTVKIADLPQVKDALSRTEALTEFAHWLLTLDDVESEQGMRDRQTVTLNNIIGRARDALGVTA